MKKIMMEILFGLIVLALIIAGLRRRKKQDRKWLQEERYDESGAWIDKRGGERGTYGSRDREMEQERMRISRSGKIEGLVLLVQNHCLERYPGLFPLEEAAGRRWLALCREKAAAFVAVIGLLLEGRTPEMPAPPARNDAGRDALKKKILDYSYDRFPALLDLDLDVIKQFDRMAAQLADEIAGLTEQYEREK